MKSSLLQVITRDFMLAFFAQFTFMIAIYSLLPTLPVYLSRLGSPASEIGVLVGAFSTASLVLRPLVGRVLLKYSERQVMVAGSLLLATTFGALFIAPPFWPMMIVRLVQGVSYAFFNTACFALAVSISPEAHRGQSISYFYVGPNVSLALAPTLGMVVVNYFSFTLLFILSLVLCLFCVAISRKLPAGQPAAVEERGAGLFFSRKAIPPSVLALMHNFCWAAVSAFLPVYAVSRGVSNPGLFFTAMAITMILGRLCGRLLDVYSREKIIFCAISAFIGVMIALSFSSSLPMLVCVGLVWGACAGFLMPTLMTTAVERGGPPRGTAVGTYSALSDLGIALGPILMGGVLTFTTYPGMFRCLAIVEITNLTYFWFFVRRREASRSGVHN